MEVAKVLVGRRDSLSVSWHRAEILYTNWNF